jgi:hypothetical protein
VRTETYKSVRDAVSRLRGKDPTHLDTKLLAEIAEHITDRTRQGCEYDYWPELVPCEERTYRDVYAAATAYAAPSATAAVEVYFPASRGYYQALRATTGNAPATYTAGAWEPNEAYWAECAASYGGEDWADATAYAVGDVVRNLDDGREYACHTAHTSSGSFDATKFGILTPWRPFISLEQTGKTAIGEVLRLSRNNPRVYRRQPGTLRWAVGDEGIVPEDGAPAVVWVEFRRRMPKFTGTAYSNTTAYAVGDVVYYSTTGECYVARAAGTGNLPTNTTYWTKQDLPYVVASFVKRAALADGLRSDGELDKAVLEESRAFEFLLAAHDAAFAGQGQHDVASVRTY